MFWKRFDKHKPKKKGWYHCTIEFNLDESTKQTYTMDLYWYPEYQTFKDNRRQNVFNLYDVYGYDVGDEKKKLYRDSLCDRTDQVIAWRNCPKPYKRFKFMKKERN